MASTAQLVAAVVFGGSALLLAYAFVGYPLLVRLLARFAPRPHETAPIEPTVSFVIAAYDEEDVIEEKLENTLAIDYPREKLQIVVASDGSTDGTHDRVAAFGRGVELFVPDRHLGKTGTANEVVAHTTGEILVFSDATGMYNPESVRALVRNFADPEVGAVSGRVTYDYDESTTAQGFAAYQRFVVPQRRAEGVFGTETSVSGSIHAIRRELFQPAPGDLSFDMVHPLHVALAGKRTVYEADATSREISRTSAAEELKSRARIAVRAFTYVPYLLRRLPSCRDGWFVFQVVSHKLLRWFSAPLLVLALLSSAVLASAGGVYVLPLLAQGVLYAAAALGIVLERLGLPAGPLATASFFTTLQAAYLVGFARYLGGSRLASWSPER